MLFAVKENIFIIKKNIGGLVREIETMKKNQMENPKL